MNHAFFNNKRILITGGAGFIGSCLVRRLCSQTNASVTVVDNLGPGSNLDAVPGDVLIGDYNLYNIDIANETALNLILEDFKPHIIYHLAAESHVDRSIAGPRSFIESNVVGTFCVLEASRRYYEKLDQVEKNHFRLHSVSTDEVYGSLRESGYFDEHSVYKPSSPYSATKAAADHLVSAWYKTYGLPVTISNCTNNYGPWQDPEKFIPKVISLLLKGEAIPLYGDGSNVRDWLYVEDHVDALLSCVEHGRIGQNYCIGARNELSNIQIITQVVGIFKNLGIEVSAKIKYVEDRLGHDYRYAINPQKAEAFLGWFPRTAFAEGLKKTVLWHLDQKA